MSEHKELESGDHNDLSDGRSDVVVKRCVDCGTSKTPLWRSGPAGPKSLCNACGIRSRKKRRSPSSTIPISLNKSNSENNSRKMFSRKQNVDKIRIKYGDDPVKMERRKLLALRSGGVSCKRPRSRSRAATNITRNPTAAAVEKLRRKMGEVEEAAVLLMTLSCGCTGSVYG